MHDPQVFDVEVKVNGKTTTLLRAAKLATAIARAQYEAKHGRRTAIVINKTTGALKEFTPKA